jgi:hypothetical protein
VVLLVGGAYWLGSRGSLRELADRIERFDATRTLGGVARGRRAELAQAYDDPARAEAEMDSYAWAVANMPTPFVGVAPAPGDHPGVHVNEQQLRHPMPLELPKPEGRFRIFVTGGSTAFGTGAPSDKATITGYLQEVIERELPDGDYEVVNAANPAWASTHERILITNRLVDWEPDLVVSFSGNNDAHFGFLGLHVAWFRTYAEHHQALLLSDLLESVTGEPMPRPWNPSSDEPVPPEEVLRRLERNLRLTSAALEGTGIPYVFALQPTLAATGKPLTEREATHLEEEQLGEGVTAYLTACYEAYRRRLPRLELPGFHFVDASTALDDRGADEEVFLDSYHFGDRGNRILAERLFELLRPFLDPGE